LFKTYGPQLIFLTFFLLLLELTLLPFVSVQGARPDLFFILLVFYALFIRPNKTFPFAVFLGVIREFFSGTLLGLQTIAFGFSGILLWLMVLKMERENLVNQGAILFVTSSLNLLILGLLEISLKKMSLPFNQILIQIFAVTVYTCLIAPFLFALIRRLLRFSQLDLMSGKKQA